MNPFQLIEKQSYTRKYSNVIKYDLSGHKTKYLENIYSQIKWRKGLAFSDSILGIAKVIPGYSLGNNHFTVKYNLIIYSIWDEHIGCGCNLRVFDSIGIQIFSKYLLPFDCNEVLISNNGKYVVVKSGGDYDEPTNPFIEQQILVYKTSTGELIDKIIVNNEYSFFTGLGKNNEIIYTKIKNPITKNVEIIIYNFLESSKYTISLPESKNEQIIEIADKGILFKSLSGSDNSLYDFANDKSIIREEIK
jgi:hypothetical protein